jgi:von Willebrand factor type A domain
VSGRLIVRLSARQRFRRDLELPVLVGITALFLLPHGGLAQGGTLALASKVRLLSCEPSSVPCFRLRFNIVNAQGAPLAVPLPAANKLAGNFRILADNQVLTPFFATALEQRQQPAPTRTVLFLIDVSGSMNKRLSTGQTRFEAAQDALREFLRGFRKGDHVAIAPFQSRQVREAIDSASFATSPQDVQEEIESLPAPEPRNNTALYSAFELGLDKLLSAMPGSRGSSLFQLYVLTDGENDVGNPGDDPGLLAGDDGLNVAASKVRADTAIQVNAIGFGDPREVDEAALKDITNRFRMFTDAAALKQFFQPPPPAPPVSEGLQVTFRSPWPDRAWLAGRTVHLRASMHLAGGSLESDDIVWAAPEIGQPLFEGKCQTEEESALLNGGAAVAAVGWASLLRPIVVFVVLGVAILLLWFTLPRLAWPEEYVGTFHPQGSVRWTPATAPVPGAVRGPERSAPPGFQAGPERVAAPHRAPADATAVFPVNRIGTRTRLELKKAAEHDR